jgi:hypothetical protein
MSWGIEVTGTKDAVKAKVAAYIEQTAKGYDGKPEADDVLACGARIQALVDALKLDDNANAVNVKAIGSHYTMPDGIGNASFSVNVTRVSLAI